MITPLGLGYVPALVALTLYALLPIIRNTIVGPTEVDPALTEAARGIGTGRIRSLATVETPLAWPVILAGIRVSTQLTMGIAAIAAYVGGPTATGRDRPVGAVLVGAAAMAAAPAAVPTTIKKGQRGPTAS